MKAEIIINAKRKAEEEIGKRCRQGTREKAEEAECYVKS